MAFPLTGSRMKVFLQFVSQIAVNELSILNRVASFHTYRDPNDIYFPMQKVEKI